MIAKPVWLRRKMLSSSRITKTRSVLKALSITTVCESARCPNICECFDRGTATFMILGSNCTRRCGFCAVGRGVPERLDPHEPERISEAVRSLGLRYVVITSVTRDDLPDGGAGHYVEVVERLRRKFNDVKIEVLVPDFGGKIESIELIYKSKIDILAHNLDTVRRLYKSVKPNSDYETSLRVLENAKRVSSGVPTKSGIMLGLGENEDEVVLTMKDLRGVGCDVITLGQYLKPAADKLDEKRFIPPKIFAKYEEIAYNLGFKSVTSGPFVRSSYRVN